MRNYCRLGSNPFATLSTINFPLSTNDVALSGRIPFKLKQQYPSCIHHFTFNQFCTFRIFYVFCV
ncbi:MAG: hypothetical protein LBE12_17625 [Planctomycetaceae bacterium]|nr:hypothetical protein [Planctomycetaceae bacterium]